MRVLKSTHIESLSIIEYRQKSTIQLFTSLLWYFLFHFTMKPLNNLSVWNNVEGFMSTRQFIIHHKTPLPQNDIILKRKPFISISQVKIKQKILKKCLVTWYSPLEVREKISMYVVGVGWIFTPTFSPHPPLKPKKIEKQTDSPGPPRPTAEPPAYKTHGTLFAYPSLWACAKMEAGLFPSCSLYRGGSVPLYHGQQKICMYKRWRNQECDYDKIFQQFFRARDNVWDVLCILKNFL